MIVKINDLTYYNTDYITEISKRNGKWYVIMAGSGTVEEITEQQIDYIVACSKYLGR